MQYKFKCKDNTIKYRQLCVQATRINKKVKKCKKTLFKANKILLNRRKELRNSERPWYLQGALTGKIQ